jgi:type II restriction/modification system DNA methylase subunit YeeA
MALSKLTLIITALGKMTLQATLRIKILRKKCGSQHKLNSAFGVIILNVVMLNAGAPIKGTPSYKVKLQLGANDIKNRS